MRYNNYSEYQRNKYGEKVYKIPINLPVTCPNRDGNIDNDGCIFCSEKGAGFESLSNELSVKEQLDKNIEYISKRYGAKKFAAYFQNYTNTYLEINRLVKYIEEACIKDIVEVSISTRPDCISDLYLEEINKVAKEKNVKVTIELGLQTVNYNTLIKINRGHTLAEFIDAVIRIRKYDFEICAHVILNLPWDSMTDAIETAKILSSLSVEQIKIHSLYIAKGTLLCEMYEKNEFEIISMDDYVERVVEFLRYLSKDAAIQRIAARAPKEDTIFCNWNTSWWVIKDKIENRLEELNANQGDKCNYLNGSALNEY